MSLGMAGFSVRGRMGEIRDGWVFRVRHVLESAHWESVISTVACFQGTPKEGGGSSKGGFPLVGWMEISTCLPESDQAPNPGTAQAGGVFV